MVKQKEKAATTKTKRPTTRRAPIKKDRHKTTVKIKDVSPYPTVTVYGSTAKRSKNVTVTIKETGAHRRTLSSPGWDVDFGKLPLGKYHVKACADGEGCTSWVPFTVRPKPFV